MDKTKRQRYKIKLPGLLQLFAVFVILLIQIVLVSFVFFRLRNYSYYIFAGMQVVSLIISLFIVRRDRNPSFALSWIIILLMMPIFGLVLYLLWGRNTKFKQSRKIIDKTQRRLKPYQLDDRKVLEEISAFDHNRTLQANYLSRNGFPCYMDTDCEYFDLGEKQFEQLFIDLENANDFIFMEYFILADGQIWSKLQDILIRKAQQGLDVRLMIDDFGSIIKAPTNIRNNLARYGIRVVHFNPVFRYISKLYLNYRNHQKITVIDGEIGHTGGINLADEYANIYSRFGHWKDTGIKLTGDAVWGMTTTFLTMWELETGSQELDYSRYMPPKMRERYRNGETDNLTVGEGFFTPFCDGPYNNPQNPSEDMYNSLINTAVDYLYIETPYFIVDDAMIKDLSKAAISGVDVCLIVPGIPDKKFVFQVTRAHYGKLLESGVKIYEYSPGFIHAKTMLADGKHAITGSINLDYRSLNLLYENGVWISDHPVLKDIKKDIDATIALCEEITLESWQQRSYFEKIFQPIIKIFSPFL